MAAKLPVETCLEIAAYLPLASLNNLSLVSKYSYILCNPILYGQISEPKYAGKHLITLAMPEARRRALGPHPASLVRTLRLRYFKITPNRSTNPKEKEEVEKIIKHAVEVIVAAINNTARVAAGRSALRAFYLYSNVAIEELGKVFLQHRRFPHLKELAVCPYNQAQGRKNLQFLTIPGLRYLEYEERIVAEYQLKKPLTLSRLCKALQIIPVSSPHLHTLKLNFEGWFHSVSGQVLQLQSELVSTINSLRLPSLRVVAIKINLYERNFPDFRPFLDAHSSLVDVSIDLGKKPLAPAALPHLRSFIGGPVDCLSVCDGQRPLESLVLILPSPNFDLSVNIERTVDNDIVCERLASTKTLRRLYLRVRNPDMEDTDPEEFEDYALCPSLIARISEGCPMLTHLELHAEDGISSCSAALRQFKHLQWLRLNIWTRICGSRYDLMQDMMYYNPYYNPYYDLSDFDEFDDSLRTATDVFPADELAEDIERHLCGALVQLRVVELNMAGEDDREDEYREDYDPAYEIEYVFEIVRDNDGVNVVLVDST